MKAPWTRFRRNSGLATTLIFLAVLHPADLITSTFFSALINTMSITTDMQIASNDRGTLEALPAELLRNVAEHLKGYVDLKALCLVSKRFSNVVQGEIFKFAILNDDNALQLIRSIVLRPEMSTEVTCLSVRFEAINSATQSRFMEYRASGENLDSFLESNPPGSLMHQVYTKMDQKMHTDLKSFWLHLLSKGDPDAVLAYLLCSLPKIKKLEIHTKQLQEGGFSFIEQVLGGRDGCIAGFASTSILAKLQTVNLSSSARAPFVGRSSFAALARLIAAPKLEEFEVDGLASPQKLSMLPIEVSLKTLTIRSFMTDAAYLANVIMSSTKLESLHVSFRWSLRYTEEWLRVLYQALALRTDTLKRLTVVPDAVNTVGLPSLTGSNAIYAAEFVGTPVLLPDMSNFTQLTHLAIPQFALLGFPAVDPQVLAAEEGMKPFWARFPREHLVNLNIIWATRDLFGYLEDLPFIGFHIFPELKVLAISFVELGATARETHAFDRRLECLSGHFAHSDVTLNWVRPPTADEELDAFFEENEAVRA
ncbi:hypothetical protein B0J12DRAFT_766464 [Macrophomina phaseolina]|uniref:F-box domain-containing protein n=1 Tax=Macrophomina phaseolina TaxID=35725 RepID=A0ABQ8GMX4_9PEZI|nr:hypothetical protein B0J12DRAFT_766464 [Macrophomina phaseolina]